MSQEWVERNVLKIFPAGSDANFLCAVDGLAYAPATRATNRILLEAGIFDEALRRDLKGRHSREQVLERVALNYLWGDDSLEGTRLSYLFETGRSEDLEVISRFFGRVGEEKLSEDQVERVLAFWDRCVTWANGIQEPPARLLSSLSRLARYLSKLDGRAERLLHAVAPHVGSGHDADGFFKQLNRLAAGGPREVSAVLDETLAAYRPSYDFEDRIKTLLTTLANSGQKAAVIGYLERLRHLSGMVEFFDHLTAGRASGVPLGGAMSTSAPDVAASDDSGGAG